MVTVVITGFMGTGKTSVGRALAARLGRSFVDTDVMVEQRTGRSVAAIFASEGEAAFRAAESAALAAALGEPGAVIATGGGALVDPKNLALVRNAAAPLVCLTARADLIVARAAAQGAVRPLLQGPEPLRRVEELRAERAPVYAKADLSIDTSERSIDDVVAEIARFVAKKEAGA
jgi:shikimate kinase